MPYVGHVDQTPEAKAQIPKTTNGDGRIAQGNEGLPALLPHPLANLRGGEDVALGPVDADGDLSTGGAQLLEEAAVGADPQVVLGDLHL